MTWQPIETAPQDGSIFDVWLGGDVELSDLQFYCVPGSRRSSDWHWFEGKFRPYVGLVSVPTFVEPTHWQPLPEPPE